MEIRISGINAFTWLTAQSGFELIYPGKGSFLHLKNATLISCETVFGKIAK